MLPTTPPGSGPRRILVVDDESIVRESIRRVIEFDGHSVDVASGAEEALAMLQRSYFDLVVTDYEMPVVKGDALAAAIKAIYPSLPVLLITAYGEQLRSAGKPLTAVDAIVGKPFGLDELRQVINALLLRPICATPTQAGQPFSGDRMPRKLP